MAANGSAAPQLIRSVRRTSGVRTVAGREGDSMTGVLRILAFGAVLNFCLFLAVGSLIGGDAMSGKNDAGRYYLANHGIYTEVNELVFWYSYFHVLSLVPALLFGAIAHWALLRESDDVYARLYRPVGGGAAAFAVATVLASSFRTSIWAALLVATIAAALVSQIIRRRAETEES
jgi:hypothetical protein